MKLLITLLALVLCSCSDMFVDEGKARPNNENLPDLTAAFVEETETRTYVENNKHLRWHEDDRITAFYGNTLNRQYKFNGLTGDNSGTFSLVPDGMLGTGNTFDRVYALYPYNTSARISDEGVITLTLPAMQTYAENSFGNGANTMIAVTENLEDTFLAFKNVCGYLKLKLYDPDGGGLKSVTIKGNNNEKIAGVATATVKFGEAPVVTMTEEATNSVTLDCGEGISLGTTVETATELWIVLPETIFTKGITIIATDVDGGAFEKSTSNEVVVERNTIQPMAALEVECEAPIDPENCKIYYTASAKVEPYNKDVFGANIISNEWNETTGQGVITFDREVSQIGNEAFYFCENLTSITIPDSVTSIGRWAFCMCSNLEYIDFGNNLTSIGSYAFNGCSFKNIVIPDHVTFLDKSVFNACEELKFVSIGRGITTIPSSAFSWCGNLELVNFSNSVSSIKEEAFKSCSSLVNITIPDSVTTIGAGAFYDCSSLTSVTIPDSVTAIAINTFKDCINLENITNGRNLNDIDPKAFDGCTSLPIIDNIKYAGGIAVEVVDKTQTSYTLKDDTYVIANELFFDCINATSISLPGKIVSIGCNAFYNCENLQSITLPEGLKFIGSYAFRYCDGLSNIMIPSTVETIKEAAFNGCRNLSEFNGKYARDKCCIIIDGILISFAIACDLSEYIIPNDVTTIADFAFEYCSSLLDITIPNSVTTIGRYAFDSCSNLSKVYCKPNIPPTVESNYYDIFGKNASGRKIYVPMQSVNLYKTATGWKNYASDIVGYDF